MENITAVLTEQPTWVRRYRITGEPTSQEWLSGRRAGTQSYCDVTIHNDAAGEPYVLSYGGEVWPSAWPELFIPPPWSIYGGAHRLTDSGKKLLGL